MYFVVVFNYIEYKISFCDKIRNGEENNNCLIANDKRFEQVNQSTDLTYIFKLIRNHLK